MSNYCPICAKRSDLCIPADHDKPHIETRQEIAAPEALPDEEELKEPQTIIHRPTLAEIEREAILEAFHRHDGNKQAVAKELGIDRRSVFNKLRLYGIESYWKRPDQLRSSS